MKNIPCFSFIRFRGLNIVKIYVFYKRKDYIYIYFSIFDTV